MEPQHINESISLVTTVRSINAYINETVMQLYAGLAVSAQKMHDNKGNLDDFPLVAAGIKKRWYEAHYFNKLGNELHDLLRFIPHKAGEPLRMFLKTIPSSMTVIEANLPGILISVGSAINDDPLQAAGRNWKRAISRYNDEISGIQHKTSPSRSKAKTDLRVIDSDEYNPETVALKGAQAQQADALVNQIIGMLPKKFQGDIRNAIAKSPNKLQALEAELMRRNIRLPKNENLNESMTYESLLKYKLNILCQLR